MKKRDQGNLFLTQDALVLLDHPYRKLDELLPFDKLSLVYQGLYLSKGRKEKGFEFTIRALINQFMEDLSNREMERYLQKNLASKWFCDMNPGEEAPDHSYFGDFRKRLGTERLMAIFSQVRNSLQGMGLIREIFTFVDASQLISKLTTWDDRDRAIRQGLQRFNHEAAGKVTTNKQARFGCKGKNKYWFGYQEHVSVDMQSGLINKVAATSAEVTGAHGFQHAIKALEANSVGSTMINLNQKILLALEIYYPSLAEQTEIVRRVESLFAYADRLEARYTAVRNWIDKLTPVILAKAFRGELVPQDANDEPASVLLERIRQVQTKARDKIKRRSSIDQPK